MSTRIVYYFFFNDFFLFLSLYCLYLVLPLEDVINFVKLELSIYVKFI